MRTNNLIDVLSIAAIAGIAWYVYKTQYFPYHHTVSDGGLLPDFSPLTGILTSAADGGVPVLGAQTRKQAGLVLNDIGIYMPPAVTGK